MFFTCQAMVPKRCVVYPKDVQLITGRSESYGVKLLNKIRHFFGKKPYQFITVSEFSEFSGIPVSQVERYLD